ncbi:nuclease [Rhodococcus sp. SRB_17]|uniref:thermonuclease family protein n=1 Tax=Acidovorax sp. SRB_24 TaxID=1962700 RepID=UPI00145DB419|nr:thermonuclease family protein [Acidovorax sp. SRB_24]NMM75544.1 nuclease [Acidovorax sp. SRB_24]NMM85063.1 nuclease [Rhodococcus sp. SRB_17]
MTLSAALLCLVVGISDGDTLTARCGEVGAYEQVRVRIAAIDAPEKRQPFGNAARQHLAALCFQQQAVISARAKDRYGRTVADVECQGKDAGQEMVRSGMAWYYVKYGAGYSHLARLESQAKGGKLSLWSDVAPEAPWNWRRGRQSQR